MMQCGKKLEHYLKYMYVGKNSLMEDPDGVSEPLCEPNNNCFLSTKDHT